MKFWKSILTLLSTITDDDREKATSYFQPMEENMEEVASLSPELLDVWALIVRWVNELPVLEEKLRAASNEEIKKSIDSEARVLNHKIDALTAMFWNEVKEEYGLWDAGNIGIRGDRRVVKILDPLCGCGERHPKISAQQLIDVISIPLSDIFGGKVAEV